jgi:sugar/nucleoside kinase (ribokinase family)
VQAALICTLGDLLLDVIVRVESPIAEDTDTYGRTRVGAGGQAANVAAWVVALGGQARVLAKRAQDPAGRLLVDELRRREVEIAGPEAETGTGVVVSIATPDGRRTMLTDRGVSPDFRPDELEPGWLEGCDWLHVSGYALAGPPHSGTALAAAELAPKVSVDLSSTAAIRQLGVRRFRALLDGLRPDVIFANEDEAALIDLPYGSAFVLKRGSRGILVWQDALHEEFSAEDVDMVDTTGAGDALAAGFLLGGPELGLRAAARCVAQLGAMP